MESMIRALRRALGLFPLTATGFTVLFGSVVALVPFGMWREDRVLVVAGVAGLLLLAVALVVTVLGAVVIWLSARAAPPIKTTLVAGHPGRTGFEITAPFWLPFLDVRWTVERPDVRSTLVARGRLLVEQWTPRRRGRPQHITRWFEVSDAFGLMGIRFPLDWSTADGTSITVLPDEGALKRVQVVRGLAAGDQFAHPEGSPQGDLMDIRAYGDGDPIRYVLWKVFAKSRTLVVRTPERALSPVRRTAAYLVAGQGDQAAAGTAKTAFENGALGDEWRFGADRCADVAEERRGALDVVMRSAGTEEESDDHAGSGLGRFIASADNPRRVVVFAPGVDGPWVDRVLDVARGTKLELVLCVDAVVPGASGFGLSRVLVRPDAEENPGRVHVTREQLASLVKRLGGVGTVRVADRQSGQVYGTAHLARLTGAA